MRLVLNGNTQSLYSIIVAADARWPHVNCDRGQIYFPEGALEAGNVGASVKIGGSGMGATNVEVDDILAEGDRSFLPSPGGSMNRLSLKTTYVRGSANNTVIFFTHSIG